MTELKKPISTDGTAPSVRPRSEIVDHMDLTETPGHLLRRAQQRAVEIFFQLVDEDGLRPPQLAVMLTIYQNPGLNQSDLVRRTGIDRSTTGDMIARLVNRNLVERRRATDDQRANHLWITQVGITALENTIESAEKVQDIIMAPIPVARREGFLDLLKLVADLPADPVGQNDGQNKEQKESKT
jgi:DNA-binding MarR family transcriptional regulator